MIFSAAEKDKDYITASVMAPKKAVLKFALMNAPEIEIFDPTELRQQVKRIF